MHWYTRSRRTLSSNEVQSIINHRVPLYLFAKKNDAEGRDYYYLGPVRSSEPVETKMKNDRGQLLDAVTMTLSMESPIEASLYDYFINNIDELTPA